METTRRVALGLAAGSVGVVGLRAGALAATTANGPAVTALRVNNLDRPLALGDAPPRFSWVLVPGEPGAGQVAYRLTVARTAAALAAGRDLLWDSGRVASSQSFDVAYGGPPMPSRAEAWWQVEVWSAPNGTPLRSEPSSWETGLLTADWQAQWLASETETAKRDRLAGLTWIAASERPASGKLTYYRWTFDHDRGGGAELLAAATATEEVWFNGVRAVATDPEHDTRKEMGIYTVRVRKGRNVLAVAVKRVTGFGVAPPVLAAILRHGAGLADRRAALPAQTRAALVAQSGWERPDFDDRAWPAAVTATGTLPVGQPWPSGPTNRLRRGFSVGGQVRSARLYATALGIYEPSLNGKRIGDARLTPEFTDPSKRVLYQAYDVTDALVGGDNILGFEVGDGWYGGKYSSSGRFAFGPAPCRLLAQIELEYVDGRREIVATGAGWEISEGPVRSNGIYDGEVHDARLDRAWTDPSGWRAAERADTPPVAVDPQRCAPIRANETLRPVALKQLASGRYVADFGQNFAGWPRLSLSAPAGTTVTMRFAELVKDNGEVDQSNLRTALQRDVYVAAGRGREVWEPRFTYHGFRYVELDGVPDDHSAWSLEGLVGYQDLDLTGEFRVGDPVIARFWRNSVWSQKSNFYGLPTDCPQRDERLGWMGDAEVFWPAAAYNMDIAAFTGRVMEDMRRGQKSNGGFPDVIPPFVPGLDLTSPGWADAGIVLPYTAWQQYGDTGVIRANWTAMDKYMAWIIAGNPDLLWTKNRGADYGDWLSVDANPANPGEATTPKDLIGTAFWAENARMMAAMADAVGDAGSAARYAALRQSLKAAFAKAYVKADGEVGNGSQTGYVLAIRFGLLEPAQVGEAGRRLAADVTRRGDHLSTGFLGTPHILDALANAGQANAAVTLLLQRSYPSWGYMVEKGATTMWERWNSDAGDTGMNSRNHYAFGAIGAFLFRRIAGIEAAEPGFAKVRLAPLIDPRLGSGGATYRSAKGTIRTDWTAANGRYRLDVELPPGVSGTVEVAPPGAKQLTAVAKPGLNRFSGSLAK